jgi:hypothetical protein
VCLVQLHDISTPASHGPLIGYAADGFGIYGYGDWSGTPVLDQCHGHFGRVPGGNAVVYHYHAEDEYNTKGQPHKPYYMGCQGPSKGKCNTTINSNYDGGANWCGQGCGYEVCVQPGTNKSAFEAYLSGFPGGSKWLDGFTVNKY